MRKRVKHTWNVKDDPKKAREAKKAIKAKRAKKAAQERRGAGQEESEKMKKEKKNLLHRGKLSKRLKPNNSRHRKRRSEKGRRGFTKKPDSTTKAIKEGKSLRDKVNNLKMRPILFMTKL